MSNARPSERKPTTRRRPAVPRYRGLSAREARTVDALRRALRAILPNGELVSLYLYGSKPHGDATIHSDIDLFLVYDDVTPAQENALKDLVSEYLSKPTGVHLYLFPANALQFADSNPIYYSASHYGIRLEGNPMPHVPLNRRQVAAAKLKRAHEDLDSAPILLNANKINNVISLSYYAAFYAAEAALASRGLVAQTHKGVETLFTLHFIRVGLVPESFKGLLGGGHHARIQADYLDPYAPTPVEFTRAQAEYWYERARDFVSFVETAVETWLAEPPLDA
jgi:hypothetical protein